MENKEIEKFKVIKVTGFFASEVQLEFGRKQNSMELYLPLSAIAYLTKVDPGNPRSDYDAHFDFKSIKTPHPLKSINPVRLKKEEVELLGTNN